MCGRFALNADATVIQQEFNLDTVPELVTARFNIAPSQPLAVISNANPKALTFYQWGLIPRWAKDPAIGNKMINARSETLHEKPSFKHAYKRHRCLIPASGFYEWAKQGKSKVPMYVHMQDHALFAFAGLWETWHSPQGDELTTCTIITTTANELLEPYHHRMAVILDKADYDLWLSPDELQPQELGHLMHPYEPHRMGIYEVSTMVNSVANDSPLCIEPSSPPPQQSTLL